MADDATQADGYYGDEELSDGELDLSFLDEDKDEDQGEDQNENRSENK